MRSFEHASEELPEEGGGDEAVGDPCTGAGV